ncbi:MAG: histidine kinase [Firmicutes bacterium]|nr:histidine kinase [Bacillota bacterium]
MTNKKTMNKKDGKYIPAELQQIDRLRSELRERCKELECIYSISRIVDKYSETDNIIRDIVNIIPDSWQFPEKTCCRVIIEDKIYTSANFQETRFRLFRSISILKEKIGIIEVFYIDPTEKLKRAPFLKAERSLLIVIAERLGKIIERKRSELALKQSYKSLQELYEHMQTIREDERRKIAMEIHDELGQALTSLKIDLRWLRNKQDTPDNKKSLSKIVSMENLVDGTIKKIQQIATELRPPLLDDFGFPEAVS